MNQNLKYRLLKFSRNFINDRFFYKMQHFYLHKKFGDVTYWAHLKKPKTFNEKLLWLKLNFRNELGQIVADKYRVRDYVKKKVGEKYLIPMLNKFTSPAEINFDQLPERFVLKPNHGSGMIIICKNRESFDKVEALKKLNRWHKMDYYNFGREWQYKNLKHYILCEEYLENENVSLIDYKFFCFNGNPLFIQVDSDRFSNHTRSIYDINWNKMPFTILFPRTEKELPPPLNLSEMIELSKKLSEGFPFVRIDLYEYLDNVYFGEITLYPGGGNEPFKPARYDQVYGDFIQLPQIR